MHEISSTKPKPKFKLNFEQIDYGFGTFLFHIYKIKRISATLQQYNIW